jgi:hypothetical protein
LFNGIEPGPPYITDEQLVKNCGKMVLLDQCRLLCCQLNQLEFFQPHQTQIDYIRIL